MPKCCLLSAAFCLFALFSPAQSLPDKLEAAVSALEKDPQMRHAILALQVVDLGSGKPVFAHNEQLGLPAASTQKVVTAAAALDLLGADYRYRTLFGYTDTVVSGTLLGSLTIAGSGDPSLGSPRFAATRPEELARQLKQALAAKGIRTVEGGLVGIDAKQERETIPPSWIWEDIGNYYGAGHAAINWKENQFDLILKPGNQPGAPVQVLRTDPVTAVEPGMIRNELRSGAAGSGDNAYLYFVPGQSGMVVRGTVPCCVDQFRISGAVSDPSAYALRSISALLGLEKSGEQVSVSYEQGSDADVIPASLRHDLMGKGGPVMNQDGGTDAPQHRNGERAWSRTHGDNAKPGASQLLYVHQSPRLDSLIYWFLQKSINLYGEALVHTIAREKTGFAAYDAGLRVIRQHWKSQGIDTAALDIIDGSGLSPQNHVTAAALTQVMRYARTRPWYPAFYQALPLYNGMKMKSGTIGGVKAYTGYAKGADGREYAFAIIAHGFIGSSADINRKLYRVLDLLK